MTLTNYEGTEPNTTIETIEPTEEFQIEDDIEY